MQDTFARARNRPEGQARATIGYLVQFVLGMLSVNLSHVALLITKQ